jgi:hypothetical protein
LGHWWYPESDFLLPFFFFSAALVLSGFGLKLMQRPMDATGNRASVVIKLHQTVNESNSSPSNPATDHSQRKCDANEITEQIPLAANPSILLHLLSSYELEPNDLAALEASLHNHYLFSVYEFSNAVYDVYDEIQTMLFRVHVNSSEALQTLSQMLRCLFQNLQHLILAVRRPCLSQ